MFYAEDEGVETTVVGLCWKAAFLSAAETVLDGSDAQ